MPKMKSNRAARKRFKVSAKGKVKCGHSFSSHKATSKSPDRKRHLRQSSLVAKVDARRVKSMLQG